MEYREILQELQTNYRQFTKTPSNPLCISASDEYWSADVKIMVFGQETYDWVGPFLHPDGVAHLLAVYDGFFNSGKCYTYGGPFFNAISKLKSELIPLFGNNDKSIALLWNNVIKIGVSDEKGTPPEDVLAWEDSLFELLQNEVAFFKTDIAIFFSGPNYDRFLQRAFPDVTSEPIAGKSTRQLSRLSSRYLPLMAIRTYHPNYLWRIGYYDYLNAIVNELRSQSDPDKCSIR